MSMTCISNLELVFPVSFEEKILMGDVPSTDIPHLDNIRQLLPQSGDEPGILTNNYSSTRNTDTALEPSTNGQDDIVNRIQVDLGNAAIPENTSPFTKNPSEDPKSNKNSLSTGILNFSAFECLSEPFPEKAETPDSIYLTHFQEILNIRKKLGTFDTCEPPDASTPSSFSPCTKMEHSGSSKIAANISDTKTILSIGSSTSPFYAANFETDKKIDDKSMGKGKMGDSAFVNWKDICPAIPATLALSVYDMPLPSPSLVNSIEVPKYLYQDFIIADMSSKRSLNERLSDVENWARRGLNNAFNRPANIGAVGIEDLMKDLQYGMSEMKEMSKRIYSLMRAANKLPDPESALFHKFERGKNRIRGDLISTGITMWHTIDNIELQVFCAYQKLKLFRNVSERSTLIANSMEQGENPDILITNAYTLVTEKLPLLRKRMDEFCKNIRAFCSKVEKLL